MTPPTPSGQAHVGLIIPVFNEVDVLPFLFRELAVFRQSRPERISVLFVDDGSTDGTAARIREMAGDNPDIRVISFSRNFGHQVAVTAGLDFCEADAAIVMDADLQDPPDVAGRMIDAWKAGADVVYGKRLEREQVGFLQRFTARLYYRFFRSFTGVDAPLDTGDFRLVSRPVIEAFRRLPEQQPYVRGLISWLGFRQEAVEYVRPGRVAGRTKYPWRRRFDLALDGLASFSGKPLRYAMRLGLLVSAGSMLGLIWVLLTKYVFETAITGWASLIFAAFFFGGMQLFFLGVIGSYLARVYDEVKGRPRYVVRSSWSSGPVGNNFGASAHPDGP
ncbi:MAG: glycosyltransferase family 2 protein [Bacteroidetes bacterium]|nr:glycosyltransferase family 2 protein [Bacteroidota bacterium]MDA0873692.1 glycosyltransferase family 2 protein [Bacteroidota bacterium]